MAQRDRDASLDHTAPAVLERYREYLIVLARTQVADPRMRERVDLSGVVQQTFLEAHQNAHELRGGSPDAVAAWLRQILAHNLADALRAAGRGKRDVSRERSLEQELEQSSLRLGDLLAADQSSPSMQMQRQERAVLLAQALAELPEPQREVVLLRHWQGMPLAKIAEQMNRTPASVVGLLQRGLRALRTALHEPP